MVNTFYGIFTVIAVLIMYIYNRYVYFIQVKQLGDELITFLHGLFIYETIK